MPSINGSFGIKLLITVLSLVAGSVDVISFLGLQGLFVSHITGNLVILTSQIVNANKMPIALSLSVPVFIIILGLTRLLVDGLKKMGWDSVRLLLLLQFILLFSFLILGVTTGAHINPNTAVAVLAGMFGVAAMAVQNALVQVSLKGAPATAVMTTNITRFVMDICEVFLRNQTHDRIVTARNRAKDIWPTIVGFTIGCALGGIYEAAYGLWALTLPVCLAFLALIIGFFLPTVNKDPS